MKNNKQFSSCCQNIEQIFLALFITACLALPLLSIPIFMEDPTDELTDSPALAWDKHDGFGG